MSSLEARKAALHAQQKDACGVGFVATVDGKPNHNVVEQGLEAIANVQHRGGVGSDGKTGDGAGVKTQLPQEFFKSEYNRLNESSLGDRKLAVGTFFLPRHDAASRKRIKKIVSEVLETEFGYKNTQWRDVPVETEHLGQVAEDCRPDIQQLIIPNKEGKAEEDLEKDLYVARRIIEKRVRDAELIGQGADTFYIPSMSSHTIVYKGLSLATDVGDVFPDLKDDKFESSYLVFHQRFSTNTAPVWERAHPYRFLAHNGEINSLRGNVNNMPLLDHMIRAAYGDQAEHILPIVQPGGSDSANVDNVIEALSHAGWSLPKIKEFLVPTAFQHDQTLSQERRDMYEYISAIAGPWDGPATLAMSDANQVMLGGDRNGLRPVRYVETSDGLIIAGSEDGMVELKPSTIIRRGNLAPGDLLGIDLNGKGILRSKDLQQQALDDFEEDHNVSEMMKKVIRFDTAVESTSADLSADALLERQVRFGFTQETISEFITPMALNGKETLGSMSDDAQPAYLTGPDIYRPLSHYFKQKFAQVTNPPIDPIREKNVTSLTTYLGAFEIDEADDLPPIQIDSPVLTNSSFHQLKGTIGDNNIATIDATFDPSKGSKSLEKRLAEIQEEAREAAYDGKHIVITDEFASDKRLAMPILLATSAIHADLNDTGRRGQISLNVRSAEATDTHDFATLIGMGADTVNAYLTEETIIAQNSHPDFFDITPEKAVANYKKSIEDGVLKIMSKMGISDVNSYRGARLFEALGLSKDMMNEHFTGVPSVISGLGIGHLQQKIEAHHNRAKQELSHGGLVRNREGELPHAINSEKIAKLQASVKETDPAKSKKLYDDYVAEVEHDAKEAPIYVRDLLEFKEAQAVSIDEVESVEAIMKRLVTGAMSMGSISKEAHETLAEAMNQLGGKSNSGEGGEDPNRLWTDKSSAIKQVASGRFGVTTDYLAEAQEIQIKVAQGAKPGEGGQLMGGKVSVEIADLRHCEPGTTLISPPPHHDIYSIEDLAQLIFDLKEVNSDAKVSVKLVASEGVETIAVGVAKAGADSIHIAGGRGGTGASPQTSILHCGQEFETALAKTHHSLMAEGFRDTVKLTTDGSLRTGRDIMMAAMMGGEEFGFGLQALIAEGCQLARVCQNGTCPVGVATQDEELRKNFVGSVESVKRMFRNIAEDVRENMAELGFKTMEEAIGRTDLLEQVAGQDLGVELDEIIPVLEGVAPQSYKNGPRSEYADPANPGFISLDRQWMASHGDAIKAGKGHVIQAEVTTQHRNIGTRISGDLAKHFKGVAKRDDHFVTLQLKGIAGQSLGAYSSNGVVINLEGAANDYVGKGLSGAQITIRPDKTSVIAQATQENTIIGNTCLYGATSGELYAAGTAGNRFAIRASGVSAVIEGAQESACEYMTGGHVVILGNVGSNFGAGMSGGDAFVYNPEQNLNTKVNDDVAAKLHRVEIGSDQEKRLKVQVEKHVERTGSKHAQGILADWDNAIKHFVHVAPSNDNVGSKWAPAVKLG